MGRERGKGRGEKIKVAGREEKGMSESKTEKKTNKKK